MAQFVKKQIYLLTSFSFMEGTNSLCIIKFYYRICKKNLLNFPAIKGLSVCTPRPFSPPLYSLSISSYLHLLDFRTPNQTFHILSTPLPFSYPVPPSDRRSPSNPPYFRCDMTITSMVQFYFYLKYRMSDFFLYFKFFYFSRKKTLRHCEPVIL